MAHNRLGERSTHVGERRDEFDFSGRDAGRVVCQQQHRVIRAHIAVDDDAVKADANRLMQGAHQHIARDVRVGGDDRQHRRHVGRDHACTLGNPGDRVAGRVLHAGELGARVGGHNRGGGVLPAVRAKLPGQRRDPVLHGVHVQQEADHARRQREHLARLAADLLGDQRRRLPGMIETDFSGAGVGAARVGDNGADRGVRLAQDGLIVEHWRGFDVVSGEYSRSVTRTITHQQGNVFLTRFFFQAAGSPGGAKSLGIVSDRHTNSPNGTRS